MVSAIWTVLEMTSVPQNWTSTLTTLMGRMRRSVSRFTSARLAAPRSRKAPSMVSTG